MNRQSRPRGRFVAAVIGSAMVLGAGWSQAAGDAVLRAQSEAVGNAINSQVQDRLRPIRPAAAGDTLIATTGTMVRAEPHRDARVVGYLLKNQEIKVIAQVPGSQWLQVDGSFGLGFVFGPLLAVKAQ
ncbi:MAG: SH3 domain-containing protein [Azospirillum sp.]|nr:SH3 domain-containing protein [Azospirillum sp.]